MHMVLSLHNIAFIISGSRAGSFPFFPLTVLHLSLSWLKSSTIRYRNRRVGCLFARRKAVANIAPLTRIPIPLTNSTFVDWVYDVSYMTPRYRIRILIDLLYIYPVSNLQYHT